MKQLSNDALEALEIIRPRIQDKNVMLSKAEFLALKVLYENINHVFNNMNITLSESCPACIPSAMKIVSNYIEYHYQPSISKPTQKAEVVIVFHTGRESELRLLSNNELKNILKKSGSFIPKKVSKDTLINAVLTSEKL